MFYEKYEGKDVKYPEEKVYKWSQGPTFFVFNLQFLLYSNSFVFDKQVSIFQIKAYL